MAAFSVVSLVVLWELDIPFSALSSDKHDRSNLVTHTDSSGSSLSVSFDTFASDDAPLFKVGSNFVTRSGDSAVDEPVFFLSVSLAFLVAA